MKEQFGEEHYIKTPEVRWTEIMETKLKRTDVGTAAKVGSEILTLRT